MTIFESTSDPIPDPLLQDSQAVVRWVRRRLARAHDVVPPEIAVTAVQSDLDGHLVRGWQFTPNPAVTEPIEADLEAWALQRGLYGPHDIDQLKRCVLPLCAVAPMPGASYAVLKPLLLFWAILVPFDDQITETGRPIAPYLEAIPRIVRNGQLPENPDRWHLAYLDVHDAIVAAGGQTLLAGFAGAVKDLMTAYLHEHQWRAEGRRISLAEYLIDGVHTGNIVTSYHLQRLVPESGLLPPSHPMPAELAHLEWLVAYLGRLENDLLNFARDEKGGYLNICTVIAAEYGISRHAAVPSAIALYEAALSERAALLAAIKTHSSPDVRSHAQGVNRWFDAYYVWYLTAERYSLIRGHDQTALTPKGS